MSVARESVGECVRAQGTSVAVDREAIGDQIYALVESLYPICRSITGDGMRQTLRVIQQQIPITIHEVSTGTQVLDWQVPREWNITDAFIKNSAGERVVDFKKSNLHVVNYSVPVKKWMSLSALKNHLFSLPEQPDLIPYRTSYYHDSWGFCLSHNQLIQLDDEEYEVCIESSLKDGSLSYGEILLSGDSTAEVLISCHSCHPSLCDDNLSGVSVATYLAKHLANLRLRYSYRFLFIPGTIGSLTWLSRNAQAVSRIRHGVVLTCVGDDGPFTYKRSRRGNATIDRAFEHVLKHRVEPHEVIDFFPYGYDERQYCSPGFDLAVGSLMRRQHGTFPEYHTSADNLAFVHPEKLEETLHTCLEVIAVLEEDRIYINQNPNGEPQLGRRGLYKTTGGQSAGAGEQMALLWVLNLADGSHSLLDIAERAKMPFRTISDAAKALCEVGLLKEAENRAA